MEAGVAARTHERQRAMEGVLAGESLSRCLTDSQIITNSGSLHWYNDKQCTRLLPHTINALSNPTAIAIGYHQVRAVLSDRQRKTMPCAASDANGNVDDEHDNRLMCVLPAGDTPPLYIHIRNGRDAEAVLLTLAGARHAVLREQMCMWLENGGGPDVVTQGQ